MLSKLDLPCAPEESDISPKQVGCSSQAQLLLSAKVHTDSRAERGPHFAPLFGVIARRHCLPLLELCAASVDSWQPGSGGRRQHQQQRSGAALSCLLEYKPSGELYSEALSFASCIILFNTAPCKDRA